MPGADGPPVSARFDLILLFGVLITFNLCEFHVFVPQGHPGKEGPGGTKGNQVRPYHNTKYILCLPS